MMDSDHRLILRQCKPLLNSRNAAVSDNNFTCTCLDVDLDLRFKK